MKSLKLTLIAAIALLTMVSACKKDEGTKPDTTRPVIAITSPANEARLNSGTKFTISGLLTDDVELSQYKIEIHDNFDGHSHKKKSAPFAFNEVKDISGKEYQLTREIEIPEDVAAGDYHLTIKAIDKAGNEAEVVELDIYIINVLDEEPPVLKVIASPKPDGSGHIHLHSGERLSLNIEGSDNKGLYEYKIEIENEKTGAVVFEKEVEVSGTSGNWFEVINIPPSWPKGEYHLHIKLIDLKNNYAEKEFEIEID